MAAAKKNVKIGLYGIGLDTYWPQFEGLLDKLTGYQKEICERMQCDGVEIVDTGIVDNLDRAREAGERFSREGVELIFLYVSTYALSSTVLPVVQRANVPVVVLNLQPVARIDYDAFNAMGDRGKMTGEWLGHCQSCSCPEIASVFNRAGIDYHLITGTLHEDVVWSEIDAWIEAVKVKAVLSNTNVGVMGHYYCGMLDVYSDMTQLQAAFGNHFELLEMCQLAKYRNETTDAEIDAMIARFKQEFDVVDECDDFEMRRAAHTSCALHKLVENHELGALAYYYEGTSGNEYENIVTSVIAGNSLLTGHNVPVAGEYEIKNVMAMKIMDELGTGGSFSEFYLYDFEDDIVMLGHDGPGHMAIAEGKVKLVPLPLYHGKPGKGLSIQMRVKHGPVTLLSVVQTGEGKVILLFAEGEAVPGPILEIGNTNSRYKFPISAREFTNKWCPVGPSHHCAIGVGHVGDKLERLAAVYGLDFVRVC